MEIRLEGAGQVAGLEPLLRDKTPPEESSLVQLCPAGPLPSELTGLCWSRGQVLPGLTLALVGQGDRAQVCHLPACLSTGWHAARTCLSRRMRQDAAPACPLSLRDGT